MIMEWLGWFSSGLSIIGVILNARKNIACWYVWLISNITWLIYYLEKKDNPAIVLWIVFTIFNVYGLIMWRRKPKETK